LPPRMMPNLRQRWAVQPHRRTTTRTTGSLPFVLRRRHIRTGSPPTVPAARASAPPASGVARPSPPGLHPGATPAGPAGGRPPAHVLAGAPAAMAVTVDGRPPAAAAAALLGGCLHPGCAGRARWWEARPAGRQAVVPQQDKVGHTIGVTRVCICQSMGNDEGASGTRLVSRGRVSVRTRATTRGPRAHDWCHAGVYLSEHGQRRGGRRVGQRWRGDRVEKATRTTPTLRVSNNTWTRAPSDVV